MNNKHYIQGPEECYKAINSSQIMGDWTPIQSKSPLPKKDLRVAQNYSQIDIEE